MSSNIVKLNNLRTSWRKAGQVIDIIRGKRVDMAIGILKFTKKYVSLNLLKLINSGVSNLNIGSKNLIIKEIYVGQGSVMKRFRPGPQGRAMMYRKKTCSVTLKLEKI